MKEAAAPFAVGIVLVVIGAVSAAMVKSRVIEYVEARENRRRRRRREGQADMTDSGGSAAKRDEPVSSDHESDAGAIAIYAAWAIDAAQALVIAIAPPILALLVFTDVAGRYLAVAYVLSTLGGLILFWRVLYADPDDWDRWVKAKGLCTPVVVVALALNLSAFVAVQIAAPEHDGGECECPSSTTTRTYTVSALTA